MFRRFWSKYWNDQFSQSIADKAAYFVKAAALIYIVRENICELTVVRYQLIAASHTHASHHNYHYLLQCVGPSMMPTFNPQGDVALVEHITVLSNNLKVGDVVTARSVQNPRHMVCKRVLGMEGDTVLIQPTTMFAPMRKVIVPKGCVWLQGDNLMNSTDSREYGPVPYALIRGRVVCKIWPPWDVGWIERQVPYK